MKSPSAGIAGRAASAGVLRQWRSPGAHSIPALVLFADANRITGLVDDQAMASWPDQSGSGVTMTQSNATYKPKYKIVGGVPYVRNVANGGFEVAGLAGFPTGNCTIVFVGKATAATTFGHVFHVGGVNVCSLTQRENEVAARAGAFFGTGSLFPQTDSVIIVSAATGASNGVTTYIDGSRSYRPYSLNNTIWPAGSSPTTGFIGGIGAGQAQAFVGDYRALLLYGTAGTVSQVMALQSYLRSYYGLGAATPADQTIIVDGDSLILGYLGNGVARSFYELVLEAQVSPFHAYNLGVSGQTTAQMLADVSTQIIPKINPAHSRNVVFTGGGTNDISQSVPAATIYATIVAYSQAVQAAGAVHVQETVLPRGTVAAQETARQTLNDLIRNGAATYGYVVSDAGGDPIIGVDGAQNDTTYFQSDKTHTTLAGDQIRASYAVAALA